MFLVETTILNPRHTKLIHSSSLFRLFITLEARTQKRFLFSFLFFSHFSYDLEDPTQTIIFLTSL